MVTACRFATLALVAAMTMAVGWYVAADWAQSVLLGGIAFYGWFAMRVWMAIERATEAERRMRGE